MRFFADLIAHGLALSISIVTLALTLEVKHDVNANPLELRPANQALTNLSGDRKEVKSNRKERRMERRRPRIRGSVTARSPRKTTERPRKKNFLSL